MLKTEKLKLERRCGENGLGNGAAKSGLRVAGWSRRFPILRGILCALKRKRGVLGTRVIFPFPNRNSWITPPAPPEMVVVAQLVEPRIVIPVVAGSSPVDHPIFPIGISSEVRKGQKET